LVLAIPVAVVLLPFVLLALPVLLFIGLCKLVFS
jgi:hypothetical protein